MSIIDKKGLEVVLRYLNAAADLLLPRYCIACGEKMLLSEKHLCLKCLADIPLTYFWTSGRNPMADRFNDILQQKIQEGEQEKYIYACALFFYDDDSPYRNIPLQIKYQGNIPAGHYFGNILGVKLKDSPAFCDIDVIIPVPLHWRRRWKRGYNQAEMIAEGIAGSLGAPVRKNILKRIRNTHTQTALNNAEKESNVEGAFIARPSNLQLTAGHILLVDDIFTTGSTLMACFRALRTVFPPSVRISVATLGFVGGA